MKNSLCVICVVLCIAVLAGCSDKTQPASPSTDKHPETPMGVEVAALPHGAPPADLKRLTDTLNSNNIPFQMLGDVNEYHAFVPRDRFDAAHKALKREQQSGLNVTLK